MTPDHLHLDRAARLAVRGHGYAEPNPLVGCVVTDAGGTVVGEGWHRRYGGPHAEVNALQAAGPAAKGGTAYVTLEPCRHHGQTPPCTSALLEAGIARVVFAVNDPHPEGSGGAEVLRAAGLEVTQVAHAASASVSAPFVHRMQSGRPWVCLKWAQSLDGYIAAPDGTSQWISGPLSRALVHRERGRVDVILTGMGTVRHDDPQLTARNVRVRRRATRVVVDSQLALPLDSRLVRGGADAPLVVATVTGADNERAERLRQAGAVVWSFDPTNGKVPLDRLLERLASERGAAHVLVESGPGLASALVAGGLVDELAVFTAPTLLGDGIAPLHLETSSMADARSMSVISRHVRGVDVLLRTCLRSE